ncbi:MAG: hypothetical protein LBH46_02785 [Rickettsiales bacterium]|nr:hypothetical protein [Rickettsiales bacterium]
MSLYNAEVLLVYQNKETKLMDEKKVTAEIFLDDYSFDKEKELLQLEKRVKVTDDADERQFLTKKIIEIENYRFYSDVIIKQRFLNYLKEDLGITNKLLFSHFNVLSLEKSSNIFVIDKDIKNLNDFELQCYIIKNGINVRAGYKDVSKNDLINDIEVAEKKKLTEKVEVKNNKKTISKEDIEKIHEEYQIKLDNQAKQFQDEISEIKKLLVKELNDTQSEIKKDKEKVKDKKEEN